MPEETDLDQQIAKNAAGPKSASQDGTSASAHSIAEQIEADRYLAGKKALKKGRRGLAAMFGRFKPPGTVG